MAYYNKTEQVDNIVPPNMEEIKLVNEIHTRFLQSMVAKSNKTKMMQDGIDAWSGEYFKNEYSPSYKSNEVSNFIFSTIENIRPIMFDNDPGFQAMARNANGVEKSNKVQIAMDYEWEREGMNSKIAASLVSSLAQGTVIYAIIWDGDKNKKDGNVKCHIISPLNFYVDPLATSIEDAEYCIYAKYCNVNMLKKMFPDKANLLEGSNIKYEELIANRKIDISVDNQVLILECWMKDYTVNEVEEDIAGKKILTKKTKYPHGRQIIVAPELNLILFDQPNPYNDGEFPFVVLKNIEVPFDFWGASEVEQLLSPQKHINDLNNQIIDNAKMTANMPWIIDKSCGISEGKLTNRPGLIIRKTPGTEVRRDQPPTMPAYVDAKVADLKKDIQIISGIHDASRGERPVGLQSGSAIMALQEAGQTRVRLKSKTMEQALSKLATKWYNRMQQFWKFDRWVRVVGEDGEYRFENITKDDLLYDFDISVTTCSTMVKNKAAMLDLVIRLSQTTAEDGLPMLDRKTVLEFLPLAQKGLVLERFNKLVQEKQNINEMQMQIDEIKQILEELMNQIVSMNKDLNHVVTEKEKFEDERQRFDIERLGFEKGFTKGSGVNQEELAFLQSLQEDEDELDENFISQIEQGILPDEVIEELESISDEELQVVLEQYPELEEILAQFK